MSITALVLLALSDASYASNDIHVSKALSFLAAHSSSYSLLANDTGAVYSASLSVFAVAVAYRRGNEAPGAIAFMLNSQREAIQSGKSILDFHAYASSMGFVARTIFEERLSRFAKGHA